MATDSGFAQSLNVIETSREASFRGHAIMGEGPMVIPEAPRNQRFRDNPYVAGEPDIRFYAGHPVRSSEGHPIGSPCVINARRPDLTPKELEDHCDLAVVGRIGSEGFLFVLANPIAAEALGAAQCVREEIRRELVMPSNASCRHSQHRLGIP